MLLSLSWTLVVRSSAYNVLDGIPDAAFLDRHPMGPRSCPSSRHARRRVPISVMFPDAAILDRHPKSPKLAKRLCLHKHSQVSLLVLLTVSFYI